MAQASVRKAEPADLEVLLPLCSDLDTLAIEEFSGERIEAAMRIAIYSDDRPWTGLIDGNPVCMFGCYPESLVTGSVFVWLLGSRALRNYPILLTKYAMPILRHLTQDYDEIITMVDRRNLIAVRFAEWLGFRDRDTIRPGLTGVYRSMELRRH